MQQLENWISGLKNRHLLPQKITASTFLALAALLILIVGSVSASFLVRLNQETRQQASTAGTGGGGGTACPYSC